MADTGKVVQAPAITARILVMVLLVAAAPHSLAQSYDEIRDELFDATNDWRQENAGLIGGNIRLMRDRILDEIMQRHVEDRVGCGWQHRGNPHLACDGSDLGARTPPGRTAAGENLIANRQVARDASIEDLGFTAPSAGRSSLCANLGAGRPVIRAPAGFPSARVPVCVDEDGEWVIEGAIDGWARSPGHRTNMLRDWVSIGIGYAEGIVFDSTCDNSARDANEHIIDTTGCSMGSIAGQMFSSGRHEGGFYSVATRSTQGFLLTDADGNPDAGGGNPGAGGGNPDAGGGEPGEDTMTQPVLPPTPPSITTRATRPITDNIRNTDRALANLFIIYQIRDDLVNDRGDEAALLEEAADAGYGELTAENIRNLPADGRLDEFFANIAFMALQGGRGREEVLQVLENLVREVSSESYAAIGEHAILMGVSTTRILRQRLSLKRIHNQSSTLNLAPETMIAATQTGEELSGLLGIEQVAAANKGHNDVSYGLWTRVYGRYNNQDQDSSLVKHDSRDHGVMAGIEIPLADERIQLGAYAGAGISDTDYDGNLANNETTYYQVGVYGSVASPGEKYYAHGAAGFTYMQHEHSRSPQLGSTDPGTAINSDYDSWMAFVSGGGGAVFNINQLILQPEVTVSYYHHDIEDIVESGDNSLRLAIGDRTEKTIAVRAGVLAARQFYIFDNRLLMLRGSLNYMYINAEDRDHQARLAVVPGSGNNFTIQGRGDRHYYEHEAGFDLRLRDTVKLSGDYRMLIDSTSTDHNFNLGLNYHF